MTRPVKSWVTAVQALTTPQPAIAMQMYTPGHLTFETIRLEGTAYDCRMAESVSAASYAPLPPAQM